MTTVTLMPFSQVNQQTVCINEDNAFSCKPIDSESNLVNDVALADLDLDGDLDIVLAQTGRNRVCKNNNVNFVCAPLETTEYNSRAVSVGKSNIDDYPDIVFGNEEINATLCINNKNDNLTFSCSFSNDKTRDLHDVQLKDLNGDSYEEAIIASASLMQICEGIKTLLDRCHLLSIPNHSSVGVVRSLATLAGMILKDHPSLIDASIAVGDLDKDGTEDIVLSGTLFPPTWCRMNKFGSSDECEMIAFATFPIVRDVQTFDLNQDGNLDLLFSLGDLDLDMESIKRESRNVVCFNKNSNVTSSGVEFDCYPINSDEFDSTGIAVFLNNK